MADTRNGWLRFRLTASCLLSLLPASAAEVFRWTDDSGRVHYGQRPPPQGAERMEIPHAGFGDQAVDTEIARRRERQRRLLDAYDYERAQKKAQQALEAGERKEAASRCAQLEGYWRKLSVPRPVYLVRADGERDYLSDQERESEKARVRPAYTRACGREP